MGIFPFFFVHTRRIFAGTACRPGGPFTCPSFCSSGDNTFGPEVEGLRSDSKTSGMSLNLSSSVATQSSISFPGLTSIRLTAKRLKRTTLFASLVSSEVSVSTTRRRIIWGFCVIPWGLKRSGVLRPSIEVAKAVGKAPSSSEVLELAIQVEAGRAERRGCRDAYCVQQGDGENP